MFVRVALINWKFLDRPEDLDVGDDICLLLVFYMNKWICRRNYVYLHYSGQFGVNVNVAKTNLLRLNTKPSQKCGQLLLLR